MAAGGSQRRSGAAWQFSWRSGAGPGYPGNVSQRLNAHQIIVKASGASMKTAGRDDFLVVNIEPFAALLRDANATQEDLTALLDAGVHAGARKRGSIETFDPRRRPDDRADDLRGAHPPDTGRCAAIECSC